MTKDQRNAGLKRCSVLKNRNLDLELILKVYEVSSVMAKTVNEQITENQEAIDKLEKATANRYEFLFNFEGGGWNSEYAYTLEEAQAIAKEKYSHSESLTPNYKTFRVSTPSDYNNLISLFY